MDSPCVDLLFMGAAISGWATGWFLGWLAYRKR